MSLRLREIGETKMIYIGYENRQLGKIWVLRGKDAELRQFDLPGMVFATSVKAFAALNSGEIEQEFGQHGVDSMLMDLVTNPLPKSIRADVLKMYVTVSPKSIYPLWLAHRIKCSTLSELIGLGLDPNLAYVPQGTESPMLLIQAVACAWDTNKSAPGYAKRIERLVELVELLVRLGANAHASANQGQASAIEICCSKPSAVFEYLGKFLGNSDLARYLTDKSLVENLVGRLSHGTLEYKGEFVPKVDFLTKALLAEFSSRADNLSSDDLRLFANSYSPAIQSYVSAKTITASAQDVLADAPVQRQRNRMTAPNL